MSPSPDRYGRKTHDFYCLLVVPLQPIYSEKRPNICIDVEILPQILPSQTANIVSCYAAMVNRLT
jgi:hypothetical protein